MLISKTTCSTLNCCALHHDINTLEKQIKKLEAERSFLAQQATALHMKLYGNFTSEEKLIKEYENDAIKYALPDDEE